eukprot:gene33896-45404_t
MTLDVVQEVRAQTAVEALRRSVAIQALVRRDGAGVTLPTDQLDDDQRIAEPRQELQPERNMPGLGRFVRAEPVQPCRRLGAAEPVRPRLQSGHQVIDRQ